MTQSRISNKKRLKIMLGKGLKVESLLMKGDSKSTLCLKKRLKVDSPVKKMTQSHDYTKDSKSNL